MLGSASDLGTYGDTNRKDATSPSYKGTREDELEFQNTLCQYVPNGGEVVSDNAYNDLPSAVESLTTMHVSYLNADYDNTVLDKWKNTTWNQNDAFYGCDGYTYIQAHLGYRYLVTKCTMKSSGFLNSQLNLSIGLQNTGFGNALKEFHATLKFKNTETGEISSVPIDYDLRKLKVHKKTLSVSLPRKVLSPVLIRFFFLLRMHKVKNKFHLQIRRACKKKDCCWEEWSINPFFHFLLSSIFLSISAS